MKSTLAQQRQHVGWLQAEGQFYFVHAGEKKNLSVLSCVCSQALLTCRIPHPPSSPETSSSWHLTPTADGGRAT